MKEKEKCQFEKRKKCEKTKREKQQVKNATNEFAKHYFTYCKKEEEKKELNS